MKEASCPHCDGKGKVLDPERPRVEDDMWETCWTCAGTGCDFGLPKHAHLELRETWWVNTSAGAVTFVDGGYRFGPPFGLWPTAPKTLTDQELNLVLAAARRAATGKPSR